VSQNPSAMFDWAIKSVTSAINVAFASSKLTESSQKRRSTKFGLE
jgi:hypothetical protein